MIERSDTSDLSDILVIERSDTSDLSDILVITKKNYVDLNSRASRSNITYCAMLPKRCRVMNLEMT